MKKLSFLSFVILSVQFCFAQKYEVIIQVQSKDTLVFRSVVNQVANLKKGLPDAVIEVVFHGPGLDFLLKDKPTYADRLNAMALTNVTLAGCENTMRQHNLKKEDLVSYATTVPSGVVEIVKKEKAGWAYLKLGF